MREDDWYQNHRKINLASSGIRTLDLVATKPLLCHCITEAWKWRNVFSNQVILEKKFPKLPQNSLNKFGEIWIYPISPDPDNSISQPWSCGLCQKIVAKSYSAIKIILSRKKFIQNGFFYKDIKIFMLKFVSFTPCDVDQKVSQERKLLKPGPYPGFSKSAVWRFLKWNIRIG